MNQAFPNPTSLTLVEKLQGNDPEAWSDYARLYLPALDRVFRLIGTPPCDSESLALQVGMRVYEKIGDFERKGPGAFRAWQRAIARNVYLEYRKSQIVAPKSVQHPDQIADRVRPTGDNLVMNELAAGGELAESEGQICTAFEDSFVIEALLAVKSKTKREIWMCFWHTVIENLTSREAAAEVNKQFQDINMTAHKVRAYKQQVSARLRKRLAEFNPD